MKNIFTIAGYKNNKIFGDMVYDCDIHVYVYNSEEDKKLFNNNELTTVINIPNNLLNNKYIYLLEAYGSDKSFGSFVNKNNIVIQYFSSEQEAINKGIEAIKTGVTNDYINLGTYDIDELDDINIYEDLNYINYTFNIYKILVNRHTFLSRKDRDEYYYNNLSKVKKNDLYDFLLDMVGGYQITSYDIFGNIAHITIISDYRDTDILSIQSLLNYHVEKFKLDDIVKIKKDNYYKKDLFKIIKVIKHDHSIYESKDPLHYREGYTLLNMTTDTIYNDYYDDYIYDEDISYK